MLPKTIFTLAVIFAAATPGLASAQAGFVQPLSTDADALAAQMRTLATNPLDVNALVTAGELSLKLDDLTAAAAFFARAEKVDPRNGRMKAGEAILLVRGERPGAALRYFAQAESYGYDPRRFAADRGLAYDLIGEQERAQRDYRVALKSASDDETIRRYALSLGISGKRDLALEQLAPLIRKSDRGAWRARAFILAMGGDVGGAEKIATTMMPPGMAQGLQRFFDRLPTLPAIDRAFAVHFGEVRAGPERFADARLAPALTPLSPEAGAPVQLASAPPVMVPPKPATKRGARSQKQKPGRVQMAQVPIPTPAKVDLPPPPPVYRPTTQPSVALAQATPVRAYVAPVRTEPRVTGTMAPTATQAAATRTTPPAAARATGTTAPAANAQVAAAGTTPPAPPASREAIRAAVPVSPAAEARLSAAAPVPSMSAAPATPGFSAGSTSVAQTAPTQAVAASVPALAPAPAASVPPANSVARAGEDQILARIVAGLSIPASELGVGAPASVPAPVAVPLAAPIDAEAVKRQQAETLATERKATEDKRVAADKIAADRKALAEIAAADRAAADRAAADKKALADKAAITKKAAADKKALAVKKAAADKKALADKAAADEKKAARADPERIWVQVAGGAYEGDLPKAWAAVKKKAPEAFAGHQGYTTPLRATNRVATGPFKTDADARAFVNALAKKGVSAFTFTSDKGQKVTKLGSK